LQVEQLGGANVLHRIFDKLVAVVANSSLDVLVCEKERGVDGCAAIDHWQQACSFDRVGDGDIGQFAECGVEVVYVAQAGAFFCFWDCGAGDNQRDMDAVLIEVLLSHKAVAADSEAVVGGKDNNCVVGLARFLQRVEHPADLGVSVGNHGIVIGGVPANFGRRPGPGCELLVADSHFAVIEGMLGHKTFGQVQLFGVVHIAIFLRCGPRVVRGGIGNVHEEGLVVFIIMQEFDGSVAE